MPRIREKMSHKLKKIELIYREFIPGLEQFTLEAIECLKTKIGEQSHFFIRESLLIADSRNISHSKPQVTPNIVTEAVNSYKLRHPSHHRNIPIIIADASILLFSLVITLIFGFQLFDKHETIAATLLTISIGAIAFAIFYKAIFDPNYNKAK